MTIFSDKRLAERQRDEQRNVEEKEMADNKMDRQAERERKTLKGRQKEKKDEGKVRNPRFESLGSS